MKTKPNFKSSCLALSLLLGTACGGAQSSQPNVPTLPPEVSSTQDSPVQKESHKEDVADTSTEVKTETKTDVGREETVDSCNLGNLVIVDTRTLTRTEDCESVSFDSIKILSGGSLTIRPGTTLVLNEKSNFKTHIEVMPEGSLTVSGSVNEKATILGSKQIVSIWLGGEAILTHVNLINGSINATKSSGFIDFENVTIQNKNSIAEGAALVLFDVTIKKFNEVTIQPAKGDVALTTTVDPLSSLSLKNLSIHSEDEAPIELYGNAISSLKVTSIPNLGFPYLVQSSFRVRGESLTVEPGVEFRSCPNCSIRFDSKFNRIGERDKAAVRFKGQDTESWIGLGFGAKNSIIHFENGLIENASGIVETPCGKAAVYLTNAAKMEVGSLTFQGIKQLFFTDMDSNITLPNMSSLHGDSTSLNCFLNN